MSRILVVKLGALGNVILSLGPFAAVRRHHAADHVSLLTTRPWADWLAASPYFDEVLIDERPEWWDLGGWLRLRKRLIIGRFDRVYDLQTSVRSSRYFHLFPHRARPEWSGIAHGCSHPDRNPNRNRLHDIDRQFDQLRAAGVRRPAGRSVLDRRRSRPLRPAGPFCAAGPRQLGAPPAQALAGAALRRAGRRAADIGHHAGHSRDGRGKRPGPGDPRRHARCDRSDQPHRPARSRQPRSRGVFRGRQRHRADAPDRRRRLPLGRAVLPRFRPGAHRPARPPVACCAGPTWPTWTLRRCLPRCHRPCLPPATPARAAPPDG